RSRSRRTTAGLAKIGVPSGSAHNWVTPPVAAARVSLATLLSERRTQVSTRPGTTSRPSALNSSAPGASRLAPMRTRRPFSMRISSTSSRPVFGSSTRPLRISKCALGAAMADSRCVLSGDTHGHDRHAHGDAEGNLVKNYRALAISDFAGDFDAASDRARVHDTGIRLGRAQAIIGQAVETEELAFRRQQCRVHAFLLQAQGNDHVDIAQALLQVGVNIDAE